MFSRLGRRLRAFGSEIIRFWQGVFEDVGITLARRFGTMLVDAISTPFELAWDAYISLLDLFDADTIWLRELRRRIHPIARGLLIPFLLTAFPFTITNLVMSSARGKTEEIERDSLDRERPTPLTPEQAASAAARGFIQQGEAYHHIVRSGLQISSAPTLIQLAKNWPTVTQLTDMRHRRIITRDQYLQLMQRQGYDEETAELIFQQSFFYPPPSDLVTWQAREVFEPDSIEKYGLDEELELVQKDAFYRAGLDDEQIRNYWIAHWQHPSWTQILEMLYRDVLVNPADRDTVEAGSGAWQSVRERNEREVWEWFRLVEVPPYWRERFIRSAYAPYTRIDIRRMWELGVASDSDVIRAYLDQGYDIEHARNLLLYTKLERTLPYIRDRYKKGWITADDVMKELLEIGLSEERARLVFERVVKNPTQPERLEPERNLTKSEIVRGVKRGVIDRETGIEMLMKLGYDREEAEFIMAINLEAGSSPETPGEMEQLVRLYQRATGQPVPLLPQQRLELERQRRETEAALARAREEGNEEQVAQLQAELARLDYLLSQISAQGS